MVRRVESALLRGTIVIALLATGGAIKCYVCDNMISKACGQYFRPYQFEAQPCKGESNKCGKQTQLPTAEGWVGVLRGCYAPGTIHGINESNGCHLWYNEDANFTAEYCFCDRDYCNAARATVLALGPSADPCSRLLSLVMLLLAFLLPSALTGPGGTSCSCSCSLAKMAQHALSSRSANRDRRKTPPNVASPRGASGACRNMTLALRAREAPATAARKVREPPSRPDRPWRRSPEPPRHALCRPIYTVRFRPDNDVHCCTERQSCARWCPRPGTLGDSFNPNTDQASAGYAPGLK